jgi:hypothetical protein
LISRNYSAVVSHRESSRSFTETDDDADSARCGNRSTWIVLRWAIGFPCRGLCGSTLAQAMEHQESYLQTVFGFLRIANVQIIRAEGLAMADAAIKKLTVKAANESNALQAA